MSTTSTVDLQPHDDLFDRHLLYDHVVDPKRSTPREQFEAVARSVRDLLASRWLQTQAQYDRDNPKRVNYLSMEFLIGRSLANNVLNLGVEPLVRSFLESGPGIEWLDLVQMEPDAGLGNGGLGRLAACFIESLATLAIPAVGHGLRYEYGMFRQELRDGAQYEQPDNWLRRADPWEVARPAEAVRVPLHCAFSFEGGQLHPVPNHPTHLLGIPYDRPVVGYKGATVNTLRLWGAYSPAYFNFTEFSSGDFLGAIVDRVSAETITRVLYPDDSTAAGQALRFLQEYFLVVCSLSDVISKFRHLNEDWHTLPDKVAVQLNDTHPAMAVAELMRTLLDTAKLDWDTAWDLTVRTLAYTNHTLLPEALEKWPIRFFDLIAPRLLEIVYEINRRFLDGVRTRYPNDTIREKRLSLIEEGADKQVRMAHLAVVGSHSTNGVAEIHSRLLRTKVLTEFAEYFPDRFNNKTNGVTPRRWLMLANPGLAHLITEAIGDGWVADLGQLRELLPLANDSAFRDGFRRAKHQAKVRMARWVRTTHGHLIDPNSVFDCQVKRIHAYKRQLLNVLHILILYNRLRADPKLDVPPRTFFFAGKAAPGYRLAKLIIKLISSVANTIDNDPAVREKLQVYFLPDYSVTLAERLIPASDVSEQISTAGYEASGTGNMKFMMNGALTIGTRDGATIEMAEEAGEDNFFMFGLSAEEVANSRGWYNPTWHYEHEPETRAALDLLFSGSLNPSDPGLFTPFRELLLTHGDFYMHLADLTAYTKAQEAAGTLYKDRDAWTKRAIANVACSSKFSSDRSIMEYANEIWHAKPCPVD